MNTLPNTDSRVTIVDAWGFNPVEVKIRRHTSPDHFISEDSRGVTYFCHSNRIRSVIEKAAPERDSLFDKLLDSIV